jgi:hypothetical protein
MKTKLSLVGVAIVTISLGLLASNGAFAQYNKMGSSSKTSTAPSGSASPGAAKPGTVLTGGVIMGTPITKEEAEKKYPAPRGGAYPAGDRDMNAKSGLVTSPYPPRKQFDCSKIGHGELALDTYTNKVFVRP